jgi:hypothetical protein
VSYIESRKIVFLLNSGEWAFPVKVESSKTKNSSFRSAPQGGNVLGTDWDENEVEVSEADMIEDVLNKGRRTRSISSSNPTPNLRGENSKDVVSVYVLCK